MWRKKKEHNSTTELNKQPNQTNNQTKQTMSQTIKTTSAELQAMVTAALAMATATKTTKKTKTNRVEMPNDLSRPRTGWSNGKAGHWIGGYVEGYSKTKFATLEEAMEEMETHGHEGGITLQSTGYTLRKSRVMQTRHDGKHETSRLASWLYTDSISGYVSEEEEEDVSEEEDGNGTDTTQDFEEEAERQEQEEQEEKKKNKAKPFKGKFKTKAKAEDKAETKAAALEEEEGGGGEAEEEEDSSDDELQVEKLVQDGKNYYYDESTRKIYDPDSTVLIGRMSDAGDIILD